MVWMPDIMLIPALILIIVKLSYDNFLLIIIVKLSYDNFLLVIIVKLSYDNFLMIIIVQHPGEVTTVRVNMLIRSMGPISETDMVQLSTFSVSKMRTEMKISFSVSFKFVNSIKW